MTHMRVGSDSELHTLLRYIAAGDDTRVTESLSRRPELARIAVADGATRRRSAPHFLVAIRHYVYAGDTALHVAAAAYDGRVARELLRLDANVAARNRRGATPLHYAATGGPDSAHWNPARQADVIECLIRAGADPNARDTSGVTPMHVAVRARCTGAVQSLLANGADPRPRNGSGSTPLHLAVQSTGRGGSGTEAAHEQQIRIIRLLIAAGARMTDTNARGKSVAEYIRGERLLSVTRSLA